MAVFHKCDSFCVLLIVLIISVLVSSEDSYYYGTLSLPQDDKKYSTEFKLLGEEGTSRRQKRGIIPEPILTPSTTSTASSSLPPTTTVTPNKEKVQKINTTLEAASNATSIPFKKKNLGENGHGIRQNITPSTTVPPLIHSVVQTVTHPEIIPDSTSKFDLFNEDELDESHFNQTLKSHNVTITRTEQNKYYNTTLLGDPQIGQHYWVNMTNRPDVKINQLLSKSHRRASTIKLSFDFPFYGHLIKNVTIATGGFLYTGDYVHSWLAATQYIAPLMANFDTSLSNESFIKYVDNGTAFSVEWEKVSLQDRPSDGQFTFQVTLLNNGDIIFVYAHLPIPIEQIKEHHHPVKVGLSDAYIMDHSMFSVRRKTIYEYERVHFNKTDIRNWTSIYLRALPTCHDHLNCNSCLTQSGPFECRWCPTFRKCSEGYDRNRQEWLEKGCEKKSFRNVSLCSAADETILKGDRSDTLYNSEISVNEDDDTISTGQVMYQSQKGNANVSGIVAIVFLVGMASGLSFWIFYAYRNPHTTSGQILIRYRPSQWRWRRGEARYTAATIHM